MSARGTALLAAVGAIGLTLAQFVAPARDWYHSWQYAALLAIALAAIVGYAWPAWRGADGTAGKRLAWAMLGALAVGIAGLLSGLIGPDTVTVIGTPGTVTPLPDLGAAAFFPAVDAQSLARGETSVTLRRRNAPSVEIGERPVPLGLAIVFTRARPAGYVVARDAAGNRLTVTQPNNSSFLSPVILFRESQPIRGQTYPMDTLAVPAAQRIVRVLYFSAADLAALRRDNPGAASGESVVLSVTDEAGRQRGLTMAPSGSAARVGDLTLSVTLGRYPVLVVASAPQPAVTLAGTIVFVLAALWAALPGGGAALRVKDQACPT